MNRENADRGFRVVQCGKQWLYPAWIIHGFERLGGSPAFEARMVPELIQQWLDGPFAVDVTRVATLRAAGYKVFTQTIPVEITPKNRLLLAEPE